MAHECEECGEQCYCDCDDTGGLEQPEDCPHFQMHDNGLLMDGTLMEDDYEDYSIEYSVKIPEPSPDQLFDMVARYCGLPPYDVRFVPRIVSVAAPPADEFLP